MDIKKRLILTNSITVVIPFTITIIAALLFIFVSSKIFNRDISYDHFQELLSVKTQLTDMRNEIWKQGPFSMEDTKFQQYLSKRLSAIEGTLVIIKNDTVVFASKEISKIDIEKCFVQGKSSNNIIKIDENTYIFEIIPLKYKDESTGNALLLVPMGQEGSMLKTFIITIISIFVIAFVVVNVIQSYLLSERIVKPISRLKRAVKEISEGDLNCEIIEDGDHEIRDLCVDFDKMRVQLKDSIHMKMKYDENRTMLVSSISHDLKTPITSIKGYVKGILDGVANTPEKKERYLKTIYLKTEQIDRMIDDLLLYSKLDLNQLPFQFEKTDIVEYFEDCIQENGLELEKENIKITLVNNLKESRYVRIDRERLRRVILNIISNSRKYMDKEQGEIRIMLRETNLSIIIEVRDNGASIDKDDVNKIFDRFYRADSARSEAKGSGLGLAIAKQIVEGHKGRIWAVSHENEGTSILISLAKAVE